MRIRLESAEQAYAVFRELWPKVKAALENSQRLTLTVTAESKSREQERMYHDLIGQIAKQAQHLGAQWSAEEWKRLLVSQFAKETGLTGGRIVPSLDGQGIVQLDFQTRRFTVKQASEFIEWLYAWGAQNGVEFKEMT